MTRFTLKWLAISVLFQLLVQLPLYSFDNGIWQTHTEPVLHCSASTATDTSSWLTQSQVHHVTRFSFFLIFAMFFYPSRRRLWTHTIKAVWSRPTSYCQSWRSGHIYVPEDLWGTWNSASPVKTKTSCWPITGPDNPSATNRTFVFVFNFFFPPKDRLLKPVCRKHGLQPCTERFLLWVFWTVAE